MSNNFPETWKLTKFGDIVRNVAKRVEPSENSDNIYVGLDHLDTDSLKIRRYGKADEVKGTKLRVQKDDIIFGKRRAYLHKLAISDFDGICSAHAFVLRSKSNEKLLDKFLPFFMQSNYFMDRAVQISVGSLSPTINWNTLKEQEFFIPPPDEQKKIEELFWEIENNILLTEATLESIEIYKQSMLKHLFTFGLNNDMDKEKLKETDIGFIPKDWEYSTIGEYCDVITGGTPNTKIKEYYLPKEIPWMRSGAIQGKPITKLDEFVSKKGLQNSNSKLIPMKSVVIALAGQGKTRGTVSKLEIECACNQSVACMHPKNENEIGYQFLFYHLSRLYKYIRKINGDENRSGLNLKIIRDLPLILPSIDIQYKITEILIAIDDLIEELLNKLNLERKMKKELLNNIIVGKIRI